METEFHKDELTVLNKLIADLTQQQREAIFTLQITHCFGDVPGAEIEEDFFTEPVSRLLCYHQGEIVGCAGTRVQETTYAGQTIRLGGISGVCTRSDLRGHGIATRVCSAALYFLTEARCDVVFLSTSPMARRLYEKLGFRPLAAFSWENIHGQVKTGTNGMLAPICSPAIAEIIWQGQDVFHVGKGYW